MKIVCMIPARLGSTRVKNKNLRLINQKPLIEYIIESAKKSKYLEDIYLNSESLIFKDIANYNGIKFYHREDHLSLDTSTNDDFALDFINNVECDILIQLLATSPFITTENIDGFIYHMLKGDYETMISVSEVKIECYYKGKPVNFNPQKQSPPSQTLEPVKSYSCGIMGWKSVNFKSNYSNYGCAYHGGDGEIGFYDLKGFSTIDIDTEEDFNLAESIVNIRDKTSLKPKYYSTKKSRVIYDSDVSRILQNDGVLSSSLYDCNNDQVAINNIIKKNGRKSSWSHTIINSTSNSATLIGQLPGEGNRMHYHPSWDEWWYVVEGEWEWIIEGKVNKIKKGEIIYIERNRSHKITAIGNKMAIRLAVSRYDVDHVYTEKNYLNE